MQKNSQMQGTSTENKSQSLKNILLELKNSANTDSVRIGTLIQRLESKGFGVLLAILSLPSALPIPAPGYSTPFGIAICLLALQMFFGRQAVWLPKTLTNFKIKSKTLIQMLTAATKLLIKIEVYIRPRWQLSQKQWFIRLVALNIGVLACLMIMPIPMTNTLPAMIIFLCAVAISENDGLICAVSIGLGMLAIAFYVSLIALGSKFSIQAIDRLF
jgi:hypothetical protein